jgi:hypothetical protein
MREMAQGELDARAAQGSGIDDRKHAFLRFTISPRK